MTRARKKAGMSKELIKHIMLAVTEVNGCAMCAYGHTKSALEMGMPMEDIEQLLSGGFDHLDKDEAAALMFAQHYAETGGEYSKSAWLRVVDIYGMDKARGILASTRMIMMGNAYGIAAGALWSRIKGKPVKKSRLCREIGSCVLMMPFAIIALVRGVFIRKYE